MRFNNNNNNSDNFVVVSNDHRYNFSRTELADRCHFFNTYFSSSFYDVTDNTMQLSVATAQIVDIKYLHLIIKLLRHNTTRHRRLLRHHNDHVGSRKLRAWTLQASGGELGEMLRVCDYFQLAGLATHYFGEADSIGGERELRIAVKLLPFADLCRGVDDDRHRLFATALRIAATSFIRARRLLRDCDVTLTRALLEERARRTRVCGIFRVDTALDADNFSTFYVIVAFSPDGDGDDGEWRPRIVDQFRLDGNERVTKAMTMYGYIYVITTQLVATTKNRRRTRIRLRQFNPYDVITNGNNASGDDFAWAARKGGGGSLMERLAMFGKRSSKLGRGWEKLPCKLLKSGLVDHVHVDIHDDDDDDDDYVICLRYWSRPATRMTAAGSGGHRRWLVGSPRPLPDDADRFDVMTKKWSRCRTCLRENERSNKFQGPDTVSQILSLDEDGEVQTTVRKSYQQYATEQEFVRTSDTDGFQLKSLTVIYPPLPTEGANHEGADVHIGVFYRILVDRSNSKGSSRFQLTQYKLGDTSQHRVLYTLSNHPQHQQLHIRNDVEDLLRHSNLAVPEILNLSAHHHDHL